LIETVPRTKSLRAHAHRVLGNRDVSPTAFVLRLERNGLEFRPGQWINLGGRASRERREYTIYSPPSEDFLEVLVKEVEGGTVSRDLRRCREGDVLEVDGPHGSFCIEPEARAGKFLFIGTGTGVSPFHCLTLSYPGLDYLFLHGVRAPQELYDYRVFDPSRVVACLSKDGQGSDGKASAAFFGRVTAWLRANPVDSKCYCYLCGNSDMIYECHAILRGYGVPASRIFAEVYF